MAAKKYDDLINNFLDLVGGKDNINAFTHCVTRLRVSLKNNNLAKIDEIKAKEGVFGTNQTGEQLQIIIGNDVTPVYDAICDKYGIGEKHANAKNTSAPKEKGKLTVGAVVSKILDGFSGCIVPFIPIMSGVAFVKVITYLCTLIGVMTEASPTYIVLTFCADVAFYFLPVYVGYNAAIKFGVTPMLGIFMGCMLISPTFIDYVSAGTALSVFGIPIYLANYSQTIFPIMIVVLVTSFVEKFFKKVIPASLAFVGVPFLTVLIMIPLSLCLLAPIGNVLGNGIASAVLWLHDTVGFVGSAVLGFLVPLLFMTGMQTAFSPYLLSQYATYGSEGFVWPIFVGWSFIVSAVLLAVMIKSKKENTKTLSTTCFINNTVSGISEPGLFGIIAPNRVALIAAMCGTAITGALMGIFNVRYCTLIPVGNVLQVLAFVDTESSMNLVFGLISILVGMVVAIAIVLLKWKEKEEA